MGRPPQHLLTSQQRHHSTKGTGSCRHARKAATEHLCHGCVTFPWRLHDQLCHRKAVCAEKDDSRIQQVWQRPAPSRWGCWWLHDLPHHQSARHTSPPRRLTHPQPKEEHGAASPAAANWEAVGCKGRPPTHQHVNDQLVVELVQHRHASHCRQLQ
jgi:hypothetical protein